MLAGPHCTTDKTSWKPSVLLVGCFSQAWIGGDHAEEGVQSQQHEEVALSQAQQLGSSD